jgi:hypothetical protein
MKYRVALWRTFGGGFSSEPVDLADHHELIVALSERGTKRCYLAQMGYYDDSPGHLGEPFSVSAVSAEHFEWLKGDFQGLIYEK